MASGSMMNLSGLWLWHGRWGDDPIDHPETIDVRLYATLSPYAKKSVIKLSNIIYYQKGLNMPQISSTPQHCPGFDSLKSLKSFICRCNQCGEAKEIFSDEFNRPHTCGKCGTVIDFSQCTLDGQAGSSDAR
jgi:hypothetical protein